MSDAVAITPKPTRNARSILPRPPAKSPHRTFGTGVALAIVMAAAPSLLRAGPPMRPTDESGNECLARAVRLVEQDKYDDAAPWYRAAVQRATDPRTRKHAQSGLDALPLLGKPAPALRTTKWIVGIPIALPQLRGRVVLLHFFDIISTESLEARQQVSDLAIAHRAKGVDELVRRRARPHADDAVR